MPTPFDQELEERLVRYVQIDTTADPTSPTSPSSACQYDLLNLLADELRALGAQDVTVTAYGALLATVPANPGVTAPTVAFLAHVDTSPAFSGTGIKPVVHRNYDGSPIHFADDPELVLDPATYPYLVKKIGDDLITASGTTLLGADDKAGVAIIMALVGHLMAHPELRHGPIRVCFTPDEEIGRGVNSELPKDLNATVAYTLDGAHLGEIVYETFSADAATVHIEGVSIHPGWAKGKLVNALYLGAKIIDLLPKARRTPETTDGREGFILVHDFHGNAAAATIQFALRDFERDGLASHGALLEQICATVQATEPRAKLTCSITPQYRNMRYWLEDAMRPVELAREACRQIGVEPFSLPTRGGTDGSRLTEMGVPTPNLFTGMQEIHGPLEWISVQDMGYATAMCVKLAELWATD